MSSATLWHDPETGVAANWNKGEAYSVTAPRSPYLNPTPRRYASAPAAIRAAKRLAKTIKTLPADWRFE